LFDLIEPRDEGQSLMRSGGIGRLGFPPVATGMCPAGDLDDLASGVLIESVIAAVGIGLQVARETFEPLCRSITLAALGEVIDRVGTGGITNVGPEARWSRASSRRIDERHRRVVGVDHFRPTDEL